MLYFYLDNGSNVCGLEFNYKNGEEEGDEDNKSLLADKADDETFYNDSSSLALKWNQKKAGGLTLSSRTGYKVCGEYMR